jgi:hypothetical protein
MTTKILTREEWKEKTPPFTFARISNPSWSVVHREMIVKWIEAHTGAGWVYWDGEEQYVFENSGDYIAFQVWIKSDPFSNDSGEIS